jgi:hypothetical protein
MVRNMVRSSFSLGVPLSLAGWLGSLGELVLSKVAQYAICIV